MQEKQDTPILDEPAKQLFHIKQFLQNLFDQLESKHCQYLRLLKDYFSHYPLTEEPDIIIDGNEILKNIVQLFQVVASEDDQALTMFGEQCQAWDDILIDYDQFLEVLCELVDTTLAKYKGPQNDTDKKELVDILEQTEASIRTNLNILRRCAETTVYGDIEYDFEEALAQTVSSLKRVTAFKQNDRGISDKNLTHLWQDCQETFMRHLEKMLGWYLTTHGHKSESLLRFVNAQRIWQGFHHHDDSIDTIDRLIEGTCKHYRLNLPAGPAAEEQQLLQIRLYLSAADWYHDKMPAIARHCLHQSYVILQSLSLRHYQDTTFRKKCMDDIRDQGEALLAFELKQITDAGSIGAFETEYKKKIRAIIRYAPDLLHNYSNHLIQPTLALLSDQQSNILTLLNDLRETIQYYDNIDIPQSKISYARRVADVIKKLIIKYHELSETLPQLSVNDEHETAEHARILNTLVNEYLDLIHYELSLGFRETYNFNSLHFSYDSNTSIPKHYRILTCLLGKSECYVTPKTYSKWLQRYLDLSQMLIKRGFDAQVYQYIYHLIRHTNKSNPASNKLLRTWHKMMAEVDNETNALIETGWRHAKEKRFHQASEWLESARKAAQKTSFVGPQKGKIWMDVKFFNSHLSASRVTNVISKINAENKAADNPYLPEFKEFFKTFEPYIKQISIDIEQIEFSLKQDEMGEDRLNAFKEALKRQFFLYFAQDDLDLSYPEHAQALADKSDDEIQHLKLQLKKHVLQHFITNQTDHEQLLSVLDLTTLPTDMRAKLKQSTLPFFAPAQSAREYPVIQHHSEVIMRIPTITKFHLIELFQSLGFEVIQTDKDYLDQKSALPNVF